MLFYIGGAKRKNVCEKRRKVSKETGLSVVSQLHRYCGFGLLIDTTGSEILIRFKFPHVLVKVAEFLLLTPQQFAFKLARNPSETTQL